MSAIIALMIIGAWCLIGFLLWSFLFKPYVHSTALRICLTILLAVVWFVGPAFDEILGAREFEQLCREMPSIKFYDPVAVGPGVFFDEQGLPKWKNSDEFSAIRRKTNVWEKEIFEKRSERHIIRRWPMTITELHSVYFDRSTHSVSLETFARYSSGGWIRSIIGIGGYQCPSRGFFPPDEERIFFKTKNNKTTPSGGKYDNN
ncbi:MAG: hypothetical protein KJ630_19745 [Proteobacteria bacterium]|nr:hypothetical protein [Pseudomonadota bacterium]